MPAPDRYHSFAALAVYEQAGLDFEIVYQPRVSRLAVLAPHGGGIEPGTSELAYALAGERHSLYIFDGRKHGGSRSLHITSTRFDEPRCLALLARSHIAVTLHGCEGSAPVVYTGGLHQELREAASQHLRTAGFTVQPDGPARAGEHPANLCNRGLSGRGLQLELSAGLRRQFFAGMDRRSRRLRTARFDRFIQALQAALDLALGDHQAA